MSWTTPGIDFLVANLVVPASINYGLLAVALPFLNIPRVPRWALVPLSVLLVPTKSIAGAIFKYHKHKRQARIRGARLPPALDSGSIGNRALIPLMRNTWKFGYPGDVFWDLIDKYGNLVNFRMMFADTLFTIDPAHVKRILSTEFENFEKGERFRWALDGVLGSGVFNSDGEMWKFHRTMARPFFSKDRTADLERFDNHVQKAISLFEQRMKAGYAVDFQDLAHRITLDMSSEFLFGNTVNSLEILVEDLPQPYNHPDHLKSLAASYKYPASEFADAFTNAQLVVAARERVGWIWPLMEMFEDKAKPFMKVVNAFIDPIVNEAVKNAEGARANSGKGEKKEVGEDETFLEHMASQTSDKKILKDQALNVLIAGRDTVAATLAFLFCLISKHPEIQSRLRTEILEQVGPSKRPTYEDVKEMKYLRAVINETLRILPPVPWDVRMCVNGAVWPSPDPNELPIYIPPDSSVPYGLLMMQTDEKLWGPDASEFDPDRFIDERKKRLLANPFMFLPFNGGPRICLGQQLAYNQLSLLVVRFMQAFSSFTMDEEAVPPEGKVPEDWAQHTGKGRKGKEAFRPKVVFTMSCQGGLWLKAVPVEGGREESQVERA